MPESASGGLARLTLERGDPEGPGQPGSRSSSPLRTLSAARHAPLGSVVNLTLLPRRACPEVTWLCPHWGG